jgi:hypothetical protein
MKGVFCLEGFWYGDHRDKTTIYPVLDLAHRHYQMPFVHHRCGTREEFIYSIRRWKTKSFHKKYPLLYLAFHGEAGKIKIGKDEITLEELAEMLEDKCEGVVIYFGSCETLHVNLRKLKNFLDKTKTLAILGYRQEVDWLISASFDILVLNYLQQHPYDTQGIAKIREELLKNCRSQVKQLDFRLVSNETWHFPRRRTTR